MMISIMTVKFFLTFLLLLSDRNKVSAAFEQCPDSLGGGYCPAGDTCCPIPNGGGSACIPNVLGNNYGTCCYDDDDSDPTTNGFITGCAVGYSCQQYQDTGVKYCSATPDVTDQILRVLPRYKLCHQSILNSYHDKFVFDLHGLPVGNEGIAIFPYYSSHGSLTNPNNQEKLNEIEYAVINVHGALRNADDLYCTTLVTVAEEKAKYGASSKNVLVIAPRFPATTDPDIYSNLVDDGEVIQWDPNDGGFGGAWRFGANAVWPPYVTNIGSYDTMDAIVQQVLRLPNLKHLSVIGHSAGGQFVQRWSVLTGVWDDTRMSSVVANPSSYVYFTNKRRLPSPTTGQLEWVIPNVTACPIYNEWMFGFQPENTGDNRSYTVPYLQRTIHGPGLDAIIQRYSQRLVIHLAGGLDHCNGTKAHRNPDCNSHGLQGTCSDELEGNNRYERHINYYKSLEEIVYGVGNFNHYRAMVDGVGHDYSLMFTSPVGLRAIFDPKSFIPPRAEPVTTTTTTVAAVIRIAGQQQNSLPTYRFFLRNVDEFIKEKIP